MDFGSFAKTIAGFAPTVAAALGGPLAGLAVEALTKTLGVDSDGLQAALAGPMSGEQIAAIKQAEIALKTRMRELDIQEESLYFADRDSARKRESAVMDGTNRNLAYLVIVSFITVTVAVLFGGLKAESVLAGTLIGYLSAKAEQVLSYYFGSSKSSDRKTELIAQSPAIPKDADHA